MSPCIRAIPLLILVAVSTIADPVAGQWSADEAGDPVNAVLRPVGDSLMIVLEVDPDWYIYGAGAAEVGLPLRLTGEAEEVVLPLRAGTLPDTVLFGAHRIPVHRGTVHLYFASREDRFRLRWAACRGDICLPRTVELRRR